MLEVPRGAAGTYTITLHPGEDFTFLYDNSLWRIGNIAFFPTLLTITTDCNNNGVLDHEELAAGRAEDCNGNHLPDSCDLSAGTSEDCTGNGIPDECEPDCNDNGVPDSCDTLAGTSEDCNGNEIPDECDFASDCNGNGTPDACECLPSESPEPEQVVIAKSRYLSFTPDSSSPGCSRTALRVTAVDLPTAFAAMEGSSYWIGAPRAISEASGLSDATSPTFTGAELGCDQHCMDWSDVGLVQAFGPQVIPGATYNIQSIACACDAGVTGNFSAPLAVATGTWGDTSMPFGGDQPDFTDISGVVDKFKNHPGAPIKALADLAENGPDNRIDFTDISYAVDAFRRLPYPFDGPTGCP